MGDDQQTPDRLAEIQALLLDLVACDAKLETLIEQGSKEERRRSEALDAKVQHAISAASQNTKRIEVLEAESRAHTKGREKLDQLASAANARSHDSVRQLEGISSGLIAHMDRERVAREARAKRADDAIGALVKGFDDLRVQSKKGSFAVIAVLLAIEFFSVVFPEAASLYRFHIEHSRSPNSAEVRP